MPATSDAREPRLLVADSFRVRVEGGVAEVRGAAQHLARFSRSVHEASAGRASGVGHFLDDAAHRISGFGEGNPRLELWGYAEGHAASSGTGSDRHASDDFELRLTLRPLPELTESLELRTAGSVALEHPERKGMNIARFAELNRELGAEALLVDPRGAVVEGATTSLLWWDGDALCTSSATERVSSVAERLLLEIAARFGLEHEVRWIAPEALARHEVWAANALHGLRRVTAVDGVPAPQGDRERLARFRAALDRTWQPIAAFGAARGRPGA